jgi:hypothetical protein
VQLLNAKLRGYNNYYGVNGNRASLDEFFYHVRRIHQRWLNQRSQRHSYTWAAYTELMRLLALEQPRIVPRGQAITLVLLRKRVFTKSPVRENRTPGSVRGLSGNWQSYRDQPVFNANDRNAQFLGRVVRSASASPHPSLNCSIDTS